MLLSVKDIVKTFKRGNQIVNAVDHVSIDIEKGDFVQLIGRSGSGKTTLLNLITGLLLPQQGELYLDGQAYHQLSDDERSILRNKKMGVISQYATVLSTLTVLENVVLPWYLVHREKEDPYGRARFLLQQFQIRELENAYPRELSGGELRRLQIARALMCDPLILIADEPTADLDKENTEIVMNLLRSINEKQETTILVVTHELDTLKYGKSVYTMSEGKLYKGNGFETNITESDHLK